MTVAVSFIGIDVGYTSISAAVPGGVRDFPHDSVGIAQLAVWAAERSPAQLRAVCESSGPYSLKLWALLAEHSIPLAIVPPQRVRANAQALGRRCKTDRIDAQVILDYAVHADPTPWTAPPREQQQLAALQQAALDLKADKRRWANRRHSLDQLPGIPPLVLELPGRLDEAFEAQLCAVNAAIEELLQSPALSSRYALLRSIPGIGPQTATILLTRAEILLTRNDKQLAAYAGLAPMHRQSGTSVRGKSRIAPGDAQLRTLLYMAALTACKYEPLKSFYNRLRAEGKPHKVARIAAARRLLLIAASVLRNDRPFYIPDPR